MGVGGRCDGGIRKQTMGVGCFLKVRLTSTMYGDVRCCTVRTCTSRTKGIKCRTFSILGHGSSREVGVDGDEDDDQVSGGSSMGEEMGEMGASGAERVLGWMQEELRHTSELQGELRHMYTSELQDAELNAYRHSSM